VKKLFALLCALLMICGVLLPLVAHAEGAAIPAEPFTWDYLATIAGAAGLTLIIVQFMKAPLDKVWKIPTRLVAYVIALIIMTAATYFTGSLTADSALLVASNAFLAAMTAYGAYELTFAKIEEKT